MRGLLILAFVGAVWTVPAFGESAAGESPGGMIASGTLGVWQIDGNDAIGVDDINLNVAIASLGYEWGQPNDAVRVSADFRVGFGGDDSQTFETAGIETEGTIDFKRLLGVGVRAEFGQKFYGFVGGNYDDIEVEISASGGGHSISSTVSDSDFGVAYGVGYRATDGGGIEVGVQNLLGASDANFIGIGFRGRF